MREADFLSRIAQQLGRTQPLRQPPAHNEQGVPDALRHAPQPPAARIAEFAANIERQGGVARVHDTQMELLQGLTSYLAELHPTSLMIADGGTLAGLSLHELLTHDESHVVDRGDHADSAERASMRERIAHADVAITGCLAAIAETGTLLLMHGSTHPRSLSLLPTVHIVIVRAEQIVTDLGAALTLLSTSQLPANALFMSGPSRSSDIENDLTIGVHGPAVVTVLIY